MFIGDPPTNLLMLNYNENHCVFVCLLALQHTIKTHI